MTTIFRLDASIRDAGSHSRALATTFEEALRGGLPGVDIVRRDIGLAPLPADAWRLANECRLKEFADLDDEEARVAALVTQLSDEMLAADAYIFAMPLYNYGVSQHAKTWIDLLLTDPRLTVKVPSPIAGRPAYLLIARGGAYGPGTPKEGWDHATPWLRRIFEDVWKLDLHLIDVELTLAEVNPEMASLMDLAATSRAEALRAATSAGDVLARRLSAPKVAEPG